MLYSHAGRQSTAGRALAACRTSYWHLEMQTWGAGMGSEAAPQGLHGIDCGLQSGVSPDLRVSFFYKSDFQYVSILQPYAIAAMCSHCMITKKRWQHSL